MNKKVSYTHQYLSRTETFQKAGSKVDLIRVVGGGRGSHDVQDCHVLGGDGEVEDLGVLPDPGGGHGLGQGDHALLQAPADAELGHGLAVLGGQ